MKDLEILIEALDLAILRMESGQTLNHALSDAPRFRCQAVWVQKWQDLRSRLGEGTSSSRMALQSFRQAARLQLRARRLVRKRSLMPIAQAGLVALSTVSFVVFTQFGFEELLELNTLEQLAIGSLLASGAFWIVWLVRQHQKEMWYLDWIDFVSEVSSRLQWGQGFLAAWKPEAAQFKYFPPALRSFLTLSRRHAERYEALPTRNIRAQKTLTSLEVRCVSRWEQVHRVFVGNERVLPLLEKESSEAFEDFCERLEIKAEALSMKLIMPLFICFAPASLLSLVAPLLRSLELS